MTGNKETGCWLRGVVTTHDDGGGVTELTGGMATSVTGVTASPHARNRVPRAPTLELKHRRTPTATANLQKSLLAPPSPAFLLVTPPPPHA